MWIWSISSFGGQHSLACSVALYLESNGQVELRMTTLWKSIQGETAGTVITECACLKLAYHLHSISSILLHTPQTTFQLLCEFYCTNNIGSLKGISHLNITKDAKFSISQIIFE